MRIFFLAIDRLSYFLIDAWDLTFLRAAITHSRISKKSKEAAFTLAGYSMIEPLKVLQNQYLPLHATPV